MHRIPLTVVDYDLPDAFLFSSTSDGFIVWQPTSVRIVLGQSNSPERSLLTDRVISDAIPVTRRPTGGEDVILTPSTIALTVARSFSVLPAFTAFFSAINSLVMEALRELGVGGLVLKGISDIALGNRKILGSSMKNQWKRLVYHGVLNISEDPSLFERYLRHPHREPDYRLNRSHSEFVTSLKNEGYHFTSEEIAEAIRESLRKYTVSL